MLQNISMQSLVNFVHQEDHVCELWIWSFGRKWINLNRQWGPHVSGAGRLTEQAGCLITVLTTRGHAAAPTCTDLHCPQSDWRHGRWPRAPLIHRHPYPCLRVEEKPTFSTRSRSHPALLFRLAQSLHCCSCAMSRTAAPATGAAATRLRPHLPEQCPRIELPTTKPSPQEVTKLEPTPSAPAVRAPHRWPTPPAVPRPSWPCHELCLIPMLLTDNSSSNLSHSSGPSPTLLPTRHAPPW
jgi:hypothetical protein